MRLFESSRQAPLFLLFICCGILQGLVYDLFYLFRRNRKGVLIHISDLLFSLFFLLSTAFTAYIGNKGELQWFFFLGILVGFYIEISTSGYFIKIFIDFFTGFIYNLYRKLASLGGVKRLFK